MTLAEIPKGASVYQPQGHAIEVFKCRDMEIISDSAAGTGKTRCYLEKIFAIVNKYDGARVLIIRKTRASMSESVLATFENFVVPKGHPCLNGPKRGHRDKYSFKNGSDIVLGGMDNPTRTFSSEYDIIYCPELTEFEESEWEQLFRALRGGVVPYQQIMGDCNPDKPTHWILQRINSGKVTRIQFTHEDNPRYFNVKTREYTEEGIAYLKRLDAMTGPRKARLRYGIWAGAEGTIYEQEWNAPTHLISEFDGFTRKTIPNEWPRVWTVDFGTTHPFVWQDWATAPDGEIILVNEIHKTETRVEDHADKMIEVTTDWRESRMIDGKIVPRRPVQIICDHDRGQRMNLVKALEKVYPGIQTVPAIKNVEGGINCVKARLTGKNGRPRLFIFRDALVEIDNVLAQAKKPLNTAQEFDGYVWDLRNGQKKGESPLKEDDDGMDALRYRVAASDFRRKITLDIK